MLSPEFPLKASIPGYLSHTESSGKRTYWWRRRYWCCCRYEQNIPFIRFHFNSGCHNSAHTNIVLLAPELVTQMQPDRPGAAVRGSPERADQSTGIPTPSNWQDNQHVA